MDLFSLENLTALSERQAYRAKAERRNLAYLQPVTWLLVGASMIGFGMALEVGRPLARLVSASQGLLLLLLLLLLRRVPPTARARGRRLLFLERAFSWLEPLASWVGHHRPAVVISFLISQYLLLVGFVALLSGEQAWPFVFPVVVVLFRLSVGETVAVHGTFLLAAIAESLHRTGTNDLAPVVIGTIVANSMALALGLFLTRRYREAFLLEWRRAVGRHEDQIRMRNELEVARELQLSMLPQASPDLDWLDIASLSQPAKEVGGDYYDFFARPDGALVVAAGDVAGHGLPSGLVLSGLRSCLTMLTDELHDPMAVMYKLDRMVRLTSRQRTLVTLSLVVIDPSSGEISVTSAGHPPLLLLRTSGDLEEVGGSALPLGVRLSREFETRRTRIARGDLLVLYSDGIYEALDEMGESFGLHRFKESIRLGNVQGSAAGVRDVVLSELQEHRREVPQSDDITLVVLRVRREIGSAEIQ